MRTLAIAGAVAVFSAAVMAQDAAKTLPDNYQVQFENEYVRVTRVHYGPHAKLPGHTHTSLASAYVYLNDSGPVTFTHIGLEYGAVTRPPTVARSFRLFRGLEEIHEVENPSDKPSDFLRVEFKTDPGPDPRTLRGKFLPPAAVTTITQNVEFENAQLRVTRIAAPGGRAVNLAEHVWPSVVISLSDGEQGRAFWLNKGQRHTLSAAPSASVEALRFELKTEVKATH